jgi:hypothetical protein
MMEPVETMLREGLGGDDRDIGLNVANGTMGGLGADTFSEITQLFITWGEQSDLTGVHP